MSIPSIVKIFGATVAASLLLIGCGASGGGSAAGGTSTSGAAAGTSVSGKLNIDGSNTVSPIATALVELYNAENKDVEISVGSAGTGAGMGKFEKGEIEIANASRPIKDSEIEKLAAAKIDFMEIPIAHDGICIVVNPQNEWLKDITIEQLNKIWNKDSKVKMWSDVDPSWPAEPIQLYGPTDAHGTYEFFNEVVNGDKENVRPDYSQQAQYDTLITSVANEKNALGYVGFAFVEQNRDKLRVVPVNGLEPTAETILDGSYKPFSRPLFMYVSAKAYTENPAAKSFVEFALGAKNAEAVQAAGYVPMSGENLAAVKARVDAGKTGSIFSTAAAGLSVSEVLKNAQ